MTANFAVDATLLLQIIGAIGGLGGTFLVNKRNVAGFYFWIVSNLALVALQVSLNIWVLAALHLAYLGLAIHGIFSWKKPENQSIS